MTDNAEPDRPSLGRFLVCSTTVHRALKVSAIVGTLLVLINQGDMLLAGTMPALWKVVLTYFVPYVVSSYSTAALLLETSRKA